MSPSSSSFLDTLFCSEDPFETEEEQVSNVGFKIKSNPQKPVLEQHDLFYEDAELISLFSREKQQNRNIEFENTSLVQSRLESVEWMLKVHTFYSFSALTAILAVDYFDRFFSSFRIDSEKPWMTQLASVACLSLAAKMEETQVPLLLDFQVVESSFVFEAKTIQRMEILVLSTLQWRMNHVTPISFLDYMIRRLGFKNHFGCQFLSKCERVLISLISSARYMCYLPSVIAAATMLHVIDSLEPYILCEHRNQILGILGIDKDKVDNCYEFFMEMTLRDHRKQSNKRKLGSMPRSPNGVINLSFSSDSSSDSWAVTSPVTSSPESISKKTKDQQHLHNAAPDRLNLPH